METIVATFTDLVRGGLAEVEERMRTRPWEHHPQLDAALEHILSSGGKRIRPTLALLVGGMLGGERERLVTLSAAIEMLHTATLVHDDLIDGSMLRRGIPTLNSQWSPGATVLTGDYVFARAAHLAAQTGSLPLMERFAQTLMTIVNGEITQLFHTRTGDTHRDYFDRIYSKTASLFELACEGAAILSRCSDSTVETMKLFGYRLGIAFQIVDDVLDFIGDPDAVGKPTASDLRQGIVTLPALIYRELHPSDRSLEDVFEGRPVDARSVTRLADAIRSSGAIGRALDQARSFAAEARELLDLLPDVSERGALHELAHYIVHRTA
jgi:geranylgeranyl pyrophosphate synthase